MVSFLVPTQQPRRVTPIKSCTQRKVLDGIIEACCAWPGGRSGLLQSINTRRDAKRRFDIDDVSHLVNAAFSSFLFGSRRNPNSCLSSIILEGLTDSRRCAPINPRHQRQICLINKSDNSSFPECGHNILPRSSEPKGVNHFDDLFRLATPMSSDGDAILPALLICKNSQITRLQLIPRVRRELHTDDVFVF